MNLCSTAGRWVCWLLLLSFQLFGLLSCSSEKEEPRVLVFSKTGGFRHTSIEAGVAAIQKLGQEHNFVVDTTEDASSIREENLKNYHAVIFLNTTGDVLNQQQQNDFERYIQAGGGYVGIHAAADTEYEWPWYGKLAGAYFESHPNNPNVLKGTFRVLDKNHPATAPLPDKWEREDEFYNFKDMNTDVRVLMDIDEKSYQGGTNGDNHPMAWYHEYDGGRAFYTSIGHTDETFSEPMALQHLLGGIQYAMGGENAKKPDYSLARTKRVPDENRFTKTVLVDNLDEPYELAVMERGRVLFIERKGDVKLYDPATEQTTVAAHIPVSTKYLPKDGKEKEAEDGLMGLALDPDFNKNHWVYLYYSPAGDEPKNILARYELKGNELDLASKKVMLEVPVQRAECCHTGGSIAFDANGNLYLSTGDNTNPFDTGYAPVDEREGRSPWDAQKSSANTNDLRGKILRIHPEPDGTYTIPEGNLFPKGTANTRPEIYTMGHRNPFRISVDKKTGFLYWGDVGPDANKDSLAVGPRGHDEFGQARKPGNFGWPHFIGDNKAYARIDFTTRTPGAKFDPAKPINSSPNNTGLQELPPAQPAFIWYPYDESKEFPLVGSGGRTAMAGPVFYSEHFKGAARPFPDYYEGKLFIYEWMRGWIMAVTMDEEGNLLSMEPFMPNSKFNNPMEMEFGPEGDLYMLDYGEGWFQQNPTAKLVKIEYNAGNRKPDIQLASDTRAGSVPLTVKLSSAGTNDPDRDELKYEWKVTTQDGKVYKTLEEPNPTLTVDKPGVYTVQLQVTDAQGATASSTMDLVAGNEPPQLALNMPTGNSTFYFPNQSFQYEVSVTDKEDGSLANGGISAEEVAFTIDYMKEGYDKIAIAQGHRGADEAVAFAHGRKLMEESDCKACHAIDKESIGPSYQQVAQKYKGDAGAVDRLANKVIQGGAGVWGEVAMSAHPGIAPDDAKEIIKYVLSLDGSKKPASSLPLKGSFTANGPAKVGGQGVYLARMAYTDKGASGVPPATAEKVVLLRHPFVAPATADQLSAGIQKYKLEEPPVEIVIVQESDSYLRFNQIDMTGISQLDFLATAPKEYLNAAGGKIEVRLGSPTGKLVGESAEIKQQSMGANRTPPRVPVTIAPTDGVQDLYFVFKGSKGEGQQGLFTISGIEFKQARPRS
ncbi:ThuA domain-containing protein [Cesiribacter sp. SM1]|uniref:ThuA domain-containing protein n=1 Tax=Cesiribacter sp. SM1 TaxID=2861196 RepID=UPI001CD5F4E0|nr:ThuA domain-containing protein [Cesiribacter sp. SM1]